MFTNNCCYYFYDQLGVGEGVAKSARIIKEIVESCETRFATDTTRHVFLRDLILKSPKELVNRILEKEYQIVQLSEFLHDSKDEENTKMANLLDLNLSTLKSGVAQKSLQNSGAGIEL